MRRLTEETVETALGKPLDSFAHQCHAASIAIVRSGLLDQPCRVARGTLPGVAGQHSWAVIGDCYAPRMVIDLTAWSYDERFPRVYVSVGGLTGHRPHGWQNIYQVGVPQCHDGDDIPLAVGTSRAAQVFLETVAERNGRTGLDRRGWANLANGPMIGWPSREIIPAMLDTPDLAALVPIDIQGMLTDRNPGGLYLAGEADTDD